jgi:hypothetical protein
VVRIEIPHRMTMTSAGLKREGFIKRGLWYWYKNLSGLQDERFETDREGGKFAKKDGRLEAGGFYEGCEGAASASRKDPLKEPSW